MNAVVLSDAGGGLGGTVRRRLAGASLLGPGGERGVGHRLRPRRHRVRAAWRWLAPVVALGSALAGVALALTPPQVRVELTASEYRVGAARLPRVGVNEYRGDGAFVLRPQPDGTIVAAGDAVAGDAHVSGSCLEDADRRAERCVFDVGGRGLGALDTWSSGAWRRRYDDGQVVDIQASSPAPVPFAVGR